MAKASFEQILEQYGKKAVEEAKKAIEKGANDVYEDAQENAPRLTSALANSITLEKKGNRYLVKSPLEYARIVEFSPKINKPFMYPALDKHRNKIKQDIIDAIKKASK